MLGAWFSLKFTKLGERASETRYTLSGNIKPFSRAPEIRYSKTHNGSGRAEEVAVQHHTKCTGFRGPCTVLSYEPQVQLPRCWEHDYVTC